jgi:hypothetical protein
MRAPDFLEKNERNCCRAVPSGRRRWGVASVAVMVGELMSPVSQSAAQECQSGKKDPSDDGKVGQRSGDASRPPSLSCLLWPLPRVGAIRSVEPPPGPAHVSGQNYCGTAHVGISGFVSAQLPS